MGKTFQKGYSEPSREGANLAAPGGRGASLLPSSASKAGFSESGKEVETEFTFHTVQATTPVGGLPKSSQGPQDQGDQNLWLRKGFAGKVLGGGASQVLR